ncbi:MAG: hypothetical protein F4X80_09175 [Chloroflexi bacterium]|nr:hypothetical protein [Chloroflexota bacterium]
MVSRVEIRLDEEHRQRLDDIVEDRDGSVSEVLRGLIDDAWEALMVERRLQLVREIASFEMEVPDDPQDLFRELESRFESDSLP